MCGRSLGGAVVVCNWFSCCHTAYHLLRSNSEYKRCPRADALRRSLPVPAFAVAMYIMDLYYIVYKSTLPVPAKHWPGKKTFGWSRRRHAYCVSAVQIRVAAGKCDPSAFARFVLFRNDVVKIRRYKFELLCRSSVESTLLWFFGCTLAPSTARRTHMCTYICAQAPHCGVVSAWHCGAWSAVARNDTTASKSGTMRATLSCTT